MSKFVTRKTEVKDRQLLEEALGALGYTFETGEAIPVRGYRETRTAEVVVRREQTHTFSDVGFVRQGGRYDAIVDDMDERRFLQPFLVEYGRQNVLKQAHLHGYRVSDQQRQADGSIRVVVQKFA